MPSKLINYAPSAPAAAKLPPNKPFDQTNAPYYHQHIVIAARHWLINSTIKGAQCTMNRFTQPLLEPVHDLVLKPCQIHQ
jgi:hypothetical protein